MHGIWRKCHFKRIYFSAQNLTALRSYRSKKWLFIMNMRKNEEIFWNVDDLHWFRMTACYLMKVVCHVISSCKITFHRKFVLHHQPTCKWFSVAYAWIRFVLMTVIVPYSYSSYSSLYWCTSNRYGEHVLENIHIWNFIILHICFVRQ